MGVYTSSIVVILPPRERFRPADAGAVALCVKEQVQLSRYEQESVVVGALEGGFDGISYQQVSPFLSLVLGKSYAYSVACCRYLKTQSPSLVEVHNRALLFLAIQRALPNVPCCLFLHNDPQSMKGCKTPKQRQQVLQKAAVVYCVSDYVRQRFLEGVSLYHERVEVIYNGMSLPLTSVAKQKVVTYAGRLIPEKGIMELVQAMAQLLPDYPDWRFEVVGAYGFGRPLGETSFEQQLMAEAQPAALQIHFAGHLPQTSVMQQLAESAIVVVASTGIDAFPRVAIEAMAHGCAVLTSASGGLKEMTAGSPYCIEQVSPATLKAAIEPLLQQPHKLAEAQAWAKSRVTECFLASGQIAKLDARRMALLGG
jgi:glycosyltransferase involved in cell wall biosynthesis